MITVECREVSSSLGIDGHESRRCLETLSLFVVDSETALVYRDTQADADTHNASTSTKIISLFMKSSARWMMYAMTSISFVGLCFFASTIMEIRGHLQRASEATLN